MERFIVECFLEVLFCSIVARFIVEVVSRFRLEPFIAERRLEVLVGSVFLGRFVVAVFSRFIAEGFIAGCFVVEVVFCHILECFIAESFLEVLVGSVIVLEVLCVVEMRCFAEMRSFAARRQRHSHLWVMASRGPSSRVLQGP